MLLAYCAPPAFLGLLNGCQIWGPDQELYGDMLTHPEPLKERPEGPQRHPGTEPRRTFGLVIEPILTQLHGYYQFSSSSLPMISQKSGAFPVSLNVETRKRVNVDWSLGMKQLQGKAILILTPCIMQKGRPRRCLWYLH